MLSNTEYISQSLGLNLFFARIMKEHSFFLQVAFTPRDKDFSRTADEFRMAFDRFLGDVIAASDQAVDPAFLRSGEIVTPYTLDAEEATKFYTGVDIATELTRMEEDMSAGRMDGMDRTTTGRVDRLNNRALDLVGKLIGFKNRILRDVLTCRMFTLNYPLLIDHITREAVLYQQMLRRLQRREALDLEQEAYEQEQFWNRIMAEHALFVRGLLDPTENDLILLANNFGNEFNELYQQSKAAMDETLPLSEVTGNSLRAVSEFRNFNTQGVEGLLECKIKSIIIPLLGDHVLRESNHFLRLLRKYSR
jgi:hypothetical protein